MRETRQAQKAIGASIIADRASWPELWTCLTFLTRVALLASTALHEHRPQVEHQVRSENGYIDTMMSGIGIGDTLLPTDRSYPRSRLIETLLRFLQSSLVFASIELNADCPYERLVHKRSIPEMYRQVKEKCAIAPIFLMAEARGSENGGMNLLGCYFYSKGRLSSMHCQVFQPEGVLKRNIKYNTTVSQPRCKSISVHPSIRGANCGFI